MLDFFPLFSHILKVFFISSASVHFRIKPDITNTECTCVSRSRPFKLSFFKVSACQKQNEGRGVGRGDHVLYGNKQKSNTKDFSFETWHVLQNSSCHGNI